MADLTSSTEIPGYTIVRRIGSGGSAEVYLAVQHSLNRRVALKLVKGTLTSDTNFAERFKREGRIIAQLSHPHIIPVYDIGEHDGQYYMAMEYLDGGDLRSQAEKLTLNDLLEIMLQVVEALQVAHDRGFVHRDIKPANILFRHAGQAVLTDFGIARQTESLTQMTVTGAMLGTPAYMSPQQINGQKLDGRSDLYSLGVTLFEMLTGYLPYRGDSMMAVAMQHTHAEIPRLPETCVFMQPLLERLLAKDAEGRISDAQALHSEMQKLLGGKNLGVSLTSLWPDTVPDSESPAGFYRGTAASAKKSASTRLLAGGLALGLMALAATISWYLAGSSPGGSQQTRATETVENSPAVEIAEDSAAGIIVPAKVPEPWEETLVLANRLFQEGRLIQPEEGNALALYRQVLQLDPDNVIARNGEQAILQSLVLQVEQRIQDRLLPQAERQLAELDSRWPDERRLLELHARITQTRERFQASQQAAAEAERQRRIDDHLQAATAAMIEGRYLEPGQTSAYHFLNRALALQPDNQAAKRGLETIADAIGRQVQTALEADDFSLAESRLADLRRIDPQHPQLDALLDDMTSGRAAFAEQQQRRQREAALQVEIDRLADRGSAWRLSRDDLAAQSAQGEQLLADITGLLNDHPQNTELRTLQESTRFRLERITAQVTQQDSPKQEKKSVIKPMVGGF